MATHTVNDEWGQRHAAERQRIAAATKLITVAQWCEYTNTAESTTRQWIAEGRIRAVSANSRHIRIPITEIDRVFKPVNGEETQRAGQ